MDRRQQDALLEDWAQREALAEDMVSMVGKLYRRQGVVITVYGRALINQSLMFIIDAHRKVERFSADGLPIEASHALLSVLSLLSLKSARVDIGKLASKFLDEEDEDVRAFLQAELAEIINGDEGVDVRQPTDVVLYGFGRIGRLLARLLIKRTGSWGNLRLRAIVVRKTGNDNDLEKRANLLRYDSIHGRFHGIVRVDEENQGRVSKIGVMVIEFRVQSLEFRV